MSEVKRSSRKGTNRIIAIFLATLFASYAPQAIAQIVANKTRPLTISEKKSAIAFAGVKPKEVMTVRGTVATFSQSGYQNLGAQIVWSEYVFSNGLCLVPVENLGATRKIGINTIHWKVAQSGSHHLPSGLSYLVWEGSNEQDCRMVPRSGLVSVLAPIPMSVLSIVIRERGKIRRLALPLLESKTKGHDVHSYYVKLLSGMSLSSVDLEFDRKRGFVYAVNFTGDQVMLMTHVLINKEQPVVVSSGIAMP